MKWFVNNRDTTYTHQTLTPSKLYAKLQSPLFVAFLSST
jgi:hypothetical protein